MLPVTHAVKPVFCQINSCDTRDNPSCLSMSWIDAFVLFYRKLKGDCSCFIPVVLILPDFIYQLRHFPEVAAFPVELLTILADSEIFVVTFCFWFQPVDDLFLGDGCQQSVAPVATAEGLDALV